MSEVWKTRRFWIWFPETVFPSWRRKHVFNFLVTWYNQQIVIQWRIQSSKNWSRWSDNSQLRNFTLNSHLPFWNLVPMISEGSKGYEVLLLPSHLICLLIHAFLLFLSSNFHSQLSEHRKFSVIDDSDSRIFRPDFIILMSNIFLIERNKELTITTFDQSRSRKHSFHERKSQGGAPTQ